MNKSWRNVTMMLMMELAVVWKRNRFKGLPSIYKMTSTKQTMEET